jgi:hypothetical protein
MPAADHGLDHNQVTFFCASHFPSDFRHHTADLVTADERVLCVRIATTVMLHVTRANAGGDGAEDYVRRAAFGQGPVTDTKPFRSIEDEGFHGRAKLMTGN